MPESILLVSTLATDLLIMVTTLWLAIYILARSQTSQSAFWASLALASLSFMYINSYIDAYDPNSDTAVWRASALLIAITAIFFLTYGQLPPDLKRNELWLSRGLILSGLATALVIIRMSVTRLPFSVDNEIYLIPLRFDSLSIIYWLFLLLASSAINFNVWQIYRRRSRQRNRSYFLALALGDVALLYALLATLIGQPLPRVIANLCLLFALVVFAYSISRYQTLLEKRIAPADLPLTALAIAAVSALFFLTALRFQMAPVEIALITILAVFTHSSYDLVREFLDRLFHRHESALNHQLRQLSRSAAIRPTLERSLDRGLAIAYHNLQASSGFIALRQNSDYIVVTAIRSLDVGSVVPSAGVARESLGRAGGGLSPGTMWLAPSYGGLQQVGVIGVGPKKGLGEYSAYDLEWLEEFADRIGALVHSYAGMKSLDRAYPASTGGDSAPEVEDPAGPTLTVDPPLEPEILDMVENGLRHLNDYIWLGNSPLASWLAVEGRTSIDRGKAVSHTIMKLIARLRPAPQRPPEPLPRDWWHYAILQDAYVEGFPFKEIMGRLQIAETTLFRYRRKAVRGLARALMETRILEAQGAAPAGSPT